VIPLLAALAVTAAAPKPIAPAQSDLVLFVRSPRAGLPGLRAFLDEAGAYAPSLRPHALGTSLGSLLGADMLDVAALEQAGANVDSPLTLSFSKHGSLLCFETKGDAAQKRMEATLAGAGAREARKHLGATLVGSAAGKVWRAGYVSKGTRTCVSSGAADARPALEAAAAAMGKAPNATVRAFRAATAKLSGPVVGFFNLGGATGGFELEAAKTQLGLRGLALFEKPLLAKPRKSDPLAGLQAPAAVTVFASLSKQALSDKSGPAAQALRFLVGNACERCDARASTELLDALRPHLFGSIALVAPRIDPSSIGGRLSQYFLFPHAYLLSLEKPEAAGHALAAFAKTLESSGVQVSAEKNLGEGPHFAVKLGDRQVFTGIAGSVLYLSNERATRDLSLAALKEAEPGLASHALALRLDGPLASSALRRISILDAPKSRELAALFALGVEAGALLRAAGVINGHAQPEGKGARFEIGFEIKR
jgi:hypothetical protein